MKEILRIPCVLINHPHDGVYFGHLIGMEGRWKPKVDSIETEGHSQNDSHEEPSLTHYP
jgi:hypothetical protein